MFKLIKLNNKIVGFKFYPTLEIGFGIFIALTCVVGTVLWLWFNRNHLLDSKFDIIALIFFLTLFGYMSKKLIVNYMHVYEKKRGVYTFFQCMTSIEKNFDISLADWDGTSIGERPPSEKNKDTLYEVILHTTIDGKSRELLFYYTIRKEEAEKIVNMLRELHHELVGDINQ